MAQYKFQTNLWREEEHSWLMAAAVWNWSSWSSISGSQSTKCAIGSTIRTTDSRSSPFSWSRPWDMVSKVSTISFVGCPRDFIASNSFWYPLLLKNSSCIMKSRLRYKWVIQQDWGFTRNISWLTWACLLSCTTAVNALIIETTKTRLSSGLNCK